jgi:hypothetical protein
MTGKPALLGGSIGGATMTNEELVLAYLEGRWKRVRGGREVFEFLRPKSAEERRAREALARLLRDGKITPSLLSLLANLIDPAASTFETRQIKIIARGRGVPPNHGRDLAIARNIVGKRAAGLKMIAAVTEAAQVYGVSVAQANRALKKHRRRFERAWIIK